MPGGYVQYSLLERGVDSVLRKKYGNYKFVLASDNYHLYLNNKVIDSLKLNKADVAKDAVDYLLQQADVEKAYATSDLMNVALPEFIKQQAINGYHPKRSGDIQIILNPGFMPGGTTGTTHGAWNPYDSHIPLLWYGWNIKPGKSNRETYMTDVAPTIAAMLRIQMPSGSMGRVIEEVSGK